MLFSLLIVLTFSATAQKIQGTGKKVFYDNGQRMKNREIIPANARLRVKEKGNLTLTFNRWTVYLEEGNYSIDSLLTAQKNTPRYITHDSIYNLLEKAALLDCKFPYKLGVPRRWPTLLTLCTCTA